VPFGGEKRHNRSSALLALGGARREGRNYTVRYEAVNAMLLNEFLKEHKKVEDLEGIVTSLAATVREQAAQIQKVSAQLEASKPARQRVNNP
jgi:1-deoxy-D-xylulose 5-phosphate reductoisomerase